MDQDPLIWWKEHEIKFPSLASLAKKYLVPQATSVPAERLFSTAGNILTKKRNKLSPDHLNKLIFINKNY